MRGVCETALHKECFDVYVHRNPKIRREKKMKYLRQFLIILAISFAGEALKCLLPLPIPASIYGMVLLFAGLQTKLIRLKDVKEAGKFLIEIMPVMFIPAGVGLMASWGVLRPVLVPVAIVTVVVIVAVMAASGWVSQFIIRTQRSNDEKNGKNDSKPQAEKERLQGSI